MEAIQRYINLKQEGRSEGEIISLMQEEGFQMKEIEDAIEQAKIKYALQENQEDFPTINEELPIPNENQGYYENTNNYEQYYSPQYSTYPTTTESFGTITELAEQVVTRKIKETNSKIESLEKNQIIFEKEIENIKERLKRIEENFDHLQRAIIGKIGDFTKNSEYIQKDLDNIHNTMSKLMNPLIDTYNELKKFNGQTKNNN